MWRSVLVAAAALLFASAGAASGQSSAALGKALYDVHCSSCHGIGLGGSSIAPSLLGVGRAAVDFELETGRMPAAVPFAQQPHQAPLLSREQIDAVTAYVTSQAPGGQPIPPLAPSSDLQTGRRLFEANCEACHGVYGQGAIVGFGWSAPQLYRATPEEIAEAVRIGPGMMPRFDAQEISPHDLDALVGYVTSLGTTTFNPGGWEIGRIGPVAEGFVAWVLGIGSLLGLARYLGTSD